MTTPRPEELPWVTNILRLLDPAALKVTATPMDTAVTVTVFERPLTNMNVQWALDPDGMTQDGVRSFGRFIEILDWMFAKADDWPRIEELRTIVTDEWRDGLRALRDDPLFEKELYREIGEFLHYATYEHKDSGT